MFISEQAPAKNRLETVLKTTVHVKAIIHYYSPKAFGCVIPASYNEAAIAVIMAAKREELVLLTRSKDLWERFKTILILPNDNPEIISLALSFRPIYIVYMDDDFSGIVSILEHIKKHFNEDVHELKTGLISLEEHKPVMSHSTKELKRKGEV
jgi:hypothetical protein